MIPNPSTLLQLLYRLEIPHLFLGRHDCKGDFYGYRAWMRACVEDMRVRFPAVAALARARVAPCATGVRQSPDCLHPLSPRRPRVLASAAPFSSGNRPHFHSIRRVLASRALVPVAGAWPRSAGGVRAPSRSSRTVRSTAPRLSAYSIARYSRDYGAYEILSLAGKN